MYYMDFRIIMVLLIFIHSRASENSNGHTYKELGEWSCTTDNDCRNDAKCDVEDTKKCSCKDGTKGDNCDIITECETDGKYKNCKGDDGTCMFENDNVVCKCSESKFLDEVDGYCKVKQLDKYIVTIVGGVLGTLLAIALIIVVVLYREKQNNKEEEVYDAKQRQTIIFSEETLLSSKQNDHDKDIELPDNISVVGLASRHNGQNCREFEDEMTIPTISRVPTIPTISKVPTTPRVQRVQISRGWNEHLDQMNMSFE